LRDWGRASEAPARGRQLEGLRGPAGGGLVGVVAIFPFAWSFSEAASTPQASSMSMTTVLALARMQKLTATL
jgi:hypothetical protein